MGDSLDRVAQPMRRSLPALLLASAAMVWTAAAVAADDTIQVRGGEIRLPAFDPDEWADSDACQLALNAAIHDLQAQQAAIPLPPPGEPGYHEGDRLFGRK